MSTPCDCWNWCRSDIQFKDGKPLPFPNHHPRCEHYNDSLMDVWEVVIPGESHGCVFHHEPDAHAMAMEDPRAQLEVRHTKMHREVYENLPEFAGF